MVDVYNFLPPYFLNGLDEGQRETIVMAINRAYTDGFSEAVKLCDLSQRNSDK